MEIDLSYEETRISRLEAEILHLRRVVDEVLDQAHAATEALSRPKPNPGPIIRRAQVTATIGPTSSGDDVGTGSALLCVVQPAPSTGVLTLYRVYPHVTVTNIVNDTGGGIAVNTLIWITMVDGYWSVLMADCANTSPSPFADQPH